MYAHTVALSLGLDAQRQAVERSQRALETGIDIQTSMVESVIDTVSRQEVIQRRLLTLQHVAVHRLLDRATEREFGVEQPAEELRSMTDDQFSSLYDTHGELFEILIDDLEYSAAAYDEVSAEYLAAVDELTELAVTATEQTDNQLQHTGESPA